MNPLYKAAAESAELGWLMGVMTALFIVCFLAWTWYAWSPANRKNMEAAARLPFEDGGEP